MSDHDHNHEPADQTPGKSEVDSRYWQSLEQWSGDPEFRKFVDQEFLSSPLREEATNVQEEGWARREFLKLMGASLAMSAAGCVRRPVEKILPYTKQPEDVTFAVDNYYSTSWSDGTEGFGLLVKTREGRPLKVEGNPQHPINGQGTSGRAQAHILALYDPERLRGPKKNIQIMDKGKERSNRDTINVSYEDADKVISEKLKEGGVAVLTGSILSPSTRAVVSDFAQAFKANTYVWDAISTEDVRLGQKESYGTDLIPSYRFDRAQVMVSIDCDFLGTWLQPTTFQKQFGSTRKADQGMSKLVVFESNYTLTGANADVRVRIKPSQQLTIAMALLHDLMSKGEGNKIVGGDSFETLPFKKAVEGLGIDKGLWDRLVTDLLKNKGRSIVVAGGMTAQTEGALKLQVAVNAINSVLGNDGVTVDYANPYPGIQGSNSDLLKLIEAMESGSVKTLILGKVNPVYASHLGERFALALRKVKTVVATSDRNDETSIYSDYLLPDHHPMETWGDHEVVSGVYTIQQPTIRPLYDTRSFQLSLMTWAYFANQGPKRLIENESFYDYLRGFWKSDIQPKVGSGQAFEDFWEGALQTGFVGGGKLEQKSSGRGFKSTLLKNLKPQVQDGYELVVYPTIMMRDGSLSNVSWLQEVPDPISKVCWDNFAAISLGTAEKAKLSEGELIELTVNDKKIKVPVHIQPGLHDQVIAVSVGYGRTLAGKIGNKVGFNAFPLIQQKSVAVAAGIPVTVRKTGVKYQLANTQGHNSMEGRKIVVEATLAEYLKDKAANNHNHPVWSIWGGHGYNGHKWGMAVDLNSCTGCSACIVACQSENNIPVVGKKYVLQGREMHWLRIDRYYVGDPKEAETVFQPVMCQQCDNAPCETVCPVMATVHSSEGLNDMVYNRCVGTRYCANNCPYKVRRFNWFQYVKVVEKPLHLAMNPDVTVRMRGVMEKCTFCTHRIKYARNQAKLEKRVVKTDEIKTACQSSCPTNALIFGDLNDPESQVAKRFKEQSAYALLEEFGAAPSVRYMTKIRNNDQATRHPEKAHEGGHA